MFHDLIILKDRLILLDQMSRFGLALLQGVAMSQCDISPQIYGRNVRFWGGRTIRPLSVQLSQVRNVTVD
jgi:hypothetical protein